MNDEHNGKKAYAAPELTDFGTVAELTQTGTTQGGSDVKEGSMASQGN